MLVDFLIVLVLVCLLMLAYVMAELDHYRRGHDVWPWTVKLALFLKGRK